MLAFCHDVCAHLSSSSFFFLSLVRIPLIEVFDGRWFASATCPLLAFSHAKCHVSRVCVYHAGHVKLRLCDIRDMWLVRVVLYKNFEESDFEMKHTWLVFFSSETFAAVILIGKREKCVDLKILCSALYVWIFWRIKDRTERKKRAFCFNATLEKYAKKNLAISLAKLLGRNRTECTLYDHGFGLFAVNAECVRTNGGAARSAHILHTYREGFSIPPSGKPHWAGDTHAKQEDGVFYIYECANTHTHACTYKRMSAKKSVERELHGCEGCRCVHECAHTRVRMRATRRGLGRDALEKIERRRKRLWKFSANERTCRAVRVRRKLY